MATCITGIEREPFDYFDIAFLGYNGQLTDYGLRYFVENNKEQVLAFNVLQRIIILKDGTRIKGIISVDERSLQGYRFDQLILFDDDRWEIFWHRAGDINRIISLTMQQSNVPEEFQILKYEDI